MSLSNKFSVTESKGNSGIYIFLALSQTSLWCMVWKAHTRWEQSSMAQHWTCDWKSQVQSVTECQENLLPQSYWATSLCWLWLQHPFHPFHLLWYIAAHKKMPLSFCPKCRWQITAKHAHILYFCFYVNRTREEGYTTTLGVPKTTLLSRKNIRN